LSMN